MSASSSPNPQNIILLAALGAGAYWFLTRRRVMAQPIAAPAPTAARPGNDVAGIAGQVVGAISNLFGRAGSAMNGTYDGRAAQPWDVTPQGASGPRFNNPSAYVSSAVDGAAFNPPTVGAFDAAYDYTGEYWY
jgi:hypothetical protein